MSDEQSGRSFKVYLAEKRPLGADEPPSVFWADRDGSAFRLYRIYNVAEGGGDRWIALLAGGRGFESMFPNESQADAQTDWREAVEGLRPLGDAIKITIVGPEWEDDERPANERSGARP